MDVSILIPVYNCLPLTQACLRSLEETLPENLATEMILVDDGSTDGTRDFLRKLPSPPYRSIFNETNLGYAAGNNRAARIATGRYLCLLNNDTILTSGWIEPMLEALHRFEDAGAVGNIQLNPETGLIDHAGVFFDPNGRPAHAYKNRRRKPRGRYREWNAITAACLLIPRTLFNEVGGLSENYRNGLEDIDLCVRLRRLGRRLYVANNSVIYHHVSSSPGRHDNNIANEKLFDERWGAVTRPWGEVEWAGQYLRRYARQWWRFNLTKFIRALKLIFLQHWKRWLRGGKLPTFPARF